MVSSALMTEIPGLGILQQQRLCREQGGIAEPCYSQGWHLMEPVRTARLDVRWLSGALSVLSLAHTMVCPAAEAFVCCLRY